MALSDNIIHNSDIINTHHNLNPKVLKNIMNIIGLTYYEVYKSRENYINISLLANRNTIGHGSELNTNEQIDFNLCIDDIEKLKEFVVSMLDWYAELIMDYALKEFYLACKETDRKTYDSLKENEFEKLFDNNNTSKRD